MDWQETKQTLLVQTPPFAIEEVQLRHRHTHEAVAHAYYRIVAPSWVNIFALTPDRQAILVRQPRVGMMQETLEIPGGNMDKGEEPLAAAHRELEEETGYKAGRLLALGSISPNPAIMTNRLHMFLALECVIPSKREHFPDAMERIELLTLSLPELELRLQAGSFQNALGALTVLMALRYAGVS